MSATIEIPTLKAQELPRQKTKMERTFVNVTISSIHIHDSKSSRKASDSLRWSIYFFIGSLAVLFIIGLFAYLKSNKHHEISALSDTR